ncbi:MAG TPA: hemolysin III family protein [Longimicrobiales bacterium]|nr:hemolysin III family protein [Longimicrobiales bacterium]
MASRKEEFVNALTHGVGVAAAVAVTALLVAFAALRDGAYTIVAVSVFGATLIALYLSSTLYHAARRPALKARLKVLDHASIYLLIAGTYTPFTLVTLRGGWGWSLFGVIWGLAATGVVFKLLWTGRFPRLSTAVYIGMGWLVIIAIVPLVHALTAPTLALLFAGGLAYTAGTLFYHSRRIPYAHAVWHLFVLAGSLLHVLAIWRIIT